MFIPLSNVSGNFILKTNRHKIFLLGNILLYLIGVIAPIGIVILIFFIAPFIFGMIFNAILLLFYSVFILVFTTYLFNEVLIYHYDTLILTDKFLIIITQQSFTNRLIEQIPLEKIENITVKPSFFGQLFSFADLIFDYNDLSVIFAMCPKYLQISETIINQHNSKAMQKSKIQTIDPELLKYGNASFSTDVKKWSVLGGNVTKTENLVNNRRSSMTQKKSQGTNKPKSTYDIIYEETIGNPYGKRQQTKSTWEIIEEETIRTPKKKK